MREHIEERLIDMNNKIRELKEARDQTKKRKNIGLWGTLLGFASIALGPIFGTIMGVTTAILGTTNTVLSDQAIQNCDSTIRELEQEIARLKNIPAEDERQKLLGFIKHLWNALEIDFDILDELFIVDETTSAVRLLNEDETKALKSLQD